MNKDFSHVQGLRGRAATQEELDWYMAQRAPGADDDYAKIGALLPASPIGSLGPHSIGAIREICRIVDPRIMLEIGFNVGNSAWMWLNYAKNLELLLSVDPSDRAETRIANSILSEQYREKFALLRSTSQECLDLLPAADFDFAFIDGAHEYEPVKKDIELMYELGIRRFAVDDFWPNFSAVQQVLGELGVEVTHQFGNIALCEID